MKSVFHNFVCFLQTLIAILQTVRGMLDSNPFVIIYALDFSKAFVCVRNKTLMDKMATLLMPDFIYNWIVEFFSHRAHVTRFDGKTSTTATINSSVIQGSAIGPAAFTVNAADMQSLYKENRLFKYADDACNVIPAKLASTSEEELSNIEQWANTI